MNSRFLPEADADLEAAAEYYDAQTPGTGRRFIRTVSDVLARLVDQPSVYGTVEPPVRGREVREVPLNPFDYRLVYEVRHDELLVLEVAHNRRRPGFWRGRLRGT